VDTPDCIAAAAQQHLLSIQPVSQSQAALGPRSHRQAALRQRGSNTSKARQGRRHQATRQGKVSRWSGTEQSTAAQRSAAAHAPSSHSSRVSISSLSSPSLHRRRWRGMLSPAAAARTSRAATRSQRRAIMSRARSRISSTPRPVAAAMACAVLLPPHTIDSKRWARSWRRREREEEGRGGGEAVNRTDRGRGKQAGRVGGQHMRGARNPPCCSS